ncbi:hypothetical protein [Haloferax profundi]
MSSPVRPLNCERAIRGDCPRTPSFRLEIRPTTDCKGLSAGGSNRVIMSQATKIVLGTIGVSALLAVVFVGMSLA